MFSESPKIGGRSGSQEEGKPRSDRTNSVRVGIGSPNHIISERQGTTSRTESTELFPFGRSPQKRPRKDDHRAKKKRI